MEAFLYVAGIVLIIAVTIALKCLRWWILARKAAQVAALLKPKPTVQPPVSADVAEKLKEKTIAFPVEFRELGAYRDLTPNDLIAKSIDDLAKEQGVPPELFQGPYGVYPGATHPVLVPPGPDHPRDVQPDTTIPAGPPVTADDAGGPEHKEHREAYEERNKISRHELAPADLESYLAKNRKRRDDADREFEEGLKEIRVEARKLAEEWLPETRKQWPPMPPEDLVQAEISFANEVVDMAVTRARLAYGQKQRKGLRTADIIAARQGNPVTFATGQEAEAERLQDRLRGAGLERLAGPGQLPEGGHEELGRKLRSTEGLEPNL